MQTVLRHDNNKKDKRKRNKGMPVHISERVTQGGVIVHMGVGGGRHIKLPVNLITIHTLF
jgi:hypothetical protein